MGPAQLAEVLRHLPKSTDPNLLVGFDTRDDAGVYQISESLALVQTMDFFTPIVDDPYAYGAIAAANALSDIYAMGGTPLTVMNIACFDPSAAPPQFWADILRGAYDKTIEAGAVVVGGHSVEDSQPKFGLSVTGTIDPRHIFSNANALPGEDIYLSKPLGTGILTTAAKADLAANEQLQSAIEAMSTLNRIASERALSAGVRCATDITGFGLAGHLYNIARASEVTLEIDAFALPCFSGVEELVRQGCTTGGAAKNQAFLGEDLQIDADVPEWLVHLVLDPQTSGGLAVTSRTPIEGSVKIGRVLAGPSQIHVRSKVGE